jgi:ribonuclease HII
MLIAGIDEAGRGPCFGPMTLAVTVFEKKDELKLRKIGVKDSKDLSPIKRNALFEIIKKEAIEYKILKLKAIQINDLMVNHNLNDIEAMEVAHLINSIKEKVDVFYIDSPDATKGKFEKRIRKHLKKEKQEVKIIAENKADSKYACVGAASILAKVTRDREAEKLREEFGDFGSLPFDEEVLTECNGITKIQKIGNIIKTHPQKLNIFAINKRTLKIEPSKVTAFIEHPKTKVFQINLDRGKKVRLSKNHPVFVLNNNGFLIEKKVEDLRSGDQIAVSGNIKRTRTISETNIFNNLKHYSTKQSPIYIKGRPIETLLSKPKNLLHKKLNVNSYSRTTIYGWKRKKAVPLHILKANIKIDFTKCKLFSRKEKVSLPVNLNLTKEVMWLLGIYIAEGWTTNYNVCISSTNKKTIEKIEKFCKTYGLHTHRNKDCIAFSSILFVKLLTAWKTGKSAKTKLFPSFIYSCNNELIKSALSGLYEGDGMKFKNAWEIELRSKELIKQIQWLKLMLNEFCSYTKRSNRHAHIAHQMPKSTNLLSPDNIPAKFGKYLLNLRKSQKLSQYELAKKTKIARELIGRIELCKCDTIQKKTLKKYYKVIPDKQILTLLNSDLCWLKIKNIKYSSTEKVYDLGVKGNENFIGGNTGIILHNSGYPSDPKTKAFLKEYFESEGKLPPFSRIFWSTCKRYIDTTDNKQQKLF